MIWYAGSLVPTPWWGSGLWKLQRDLRMMKHGPWRGKYIGIRPITVPWPFLQLWLMSLNWHPYDTDIHHFDTIYGISLCSCYSRSKCLLLLQQLLLPLPQPSPPQLSPPLLLLLLSMKVSITKCLCLFILHPIRQTYNDSRESIQCCRWPANLEMPVYAYVSPVILASLVIGKFGFMYISPVSTC